MQSDYREFAARRHRILAHYLETYCWRNHADCILITRYELEVYLNLEKFKSERLDWLKADIKDSFPFVTYFFEEDVFSDAALSRVDLMSLPLPTRTEETFLAENPHMVQYQGQDIPDINFGLQMKMISWDEYIANYISYDKVSLHQRVSLSSKTTRLNSDHKITEVAVLAGLSLTISGLVDRTVYHNVEQSDAPNGYP
jgi:hypothetical protein